MPAWAVRNRGQFLFHLAEVACQAFVGRTCYLGVDGWALSMRSYTQFTTNRRQRFKMVGIYICLSAK